MAGAPEAEVEWSLSRRQTRSYTGSDTLLMRTVYKHIDVYYVDTVSL